MLGSDSREAFHTPVPDPGRARVELGAALAVAATLEDDAVLAKRELGT